LSQQDRAARPRPGQGRDRRGRAGDAGRKVERRDERAETRDGRSYREVRYGAFRRAFALPAHITAQAVSASYDAGVLSIRVAGAYAGSQAQRIEVTGPAGETTRRSSQPSKTQSNSHEATCPHG